MLKKDFYHLRFAMILILLYSTFMQIFFCTICPLKAFTGISCPTCGLTHATIYLFTGRWKEAFLTNPTVLLWLIVIFLFVTDRYIYKLKVKVFPYLFIIVGIITIGWYIFNIIF